MPQNQETRLIMGGMNLDDALPTIQSPDYIEAYNLRSGTAEQENGYGTNIESGLDITSTRPSGINKGVGIKGFESLRKAYGFIFNSQGFHLLIEIDDDTKMEAILFTNKTDSNGVDILSLTPDTTIDDISLINDEFLVWTDTKSEINCVSLKRLKNGSYGILTKEDLLLIKPQNLKPVIAQYGDDAGRASNNLSQKIFQFISQYEGHDYTYSAWSTNSKRPIPTYESTPAVGTDVTKNNNLIVSVDIGNSRVKTVVVGARYALLDWFEIKRVDRNYILALPNTTTNPANEVYEAYDPSTNTYSFVFYNDGLYQTIPATQTDLAYDFIPLRAGTLEVINGNIISLADITEGYDKPVVDVDLSVSAYNPNFQSNDTSGQPFKIGFTENFKKGGSNRRQVTVKYIGQPKTGDVMTIVLHDVRDYTNKVTYTYIVPSALQNNLAGAVYAFQKTIPNSNSFPDIYNDYGITLLTSDYFELESATIDLANVDTGISQAIHALKSNSSYQLALSYRDAYGRYFPLITGNEFIVKTPSYGQTKGATPSINWNINNVVAPVGAVDYQWLISNNTTHETSLYTLGTVLFYITTWDAKNNQQPLAAGGGTVGDTLQVSVSGDQNLGNGTTTYNVGDYVTYNGKTWDRIDKTYGDLTSNSDYIYINLLSLKNFNVKSSSSILNYQYTEGDRATLYYYRKNDTITWLDNPAIEAEVVGFDPTTYLLKIRKPDALSLNTLDDQNILLEIYTPRKRADSSTSTDEQNTVFYEIGERFTITNGQHDTLNGVITEGDVFFKTRKMTGSTDANQVYDLLVESNHFSDYYISNYSSYGRPRTVFDTPETTNKKASIRYSDVYVIGSKNNGLTRFFAERIYGEGDGESSSSYGAIRKLYQRGNVVICFQENEIGYIPVFSSIVEDQAEQQQYAISDKLFNKIRYNGSRIGMGNGKSTFSVRYNDCRFVDTNNCVPMRAGLDGVKPIGDKLNKFFKKAIQDAITNKLSMNAYDNNFYNEYILSIDTIGDKVNTVPFDELSWVTDNNYTVQPNAITITTQPSNGIQSYNNTTGIDTYTPNNNGFTGNDSFQFSFVAGGQTITRKACIAVQAGTGTVNDFNFQDVTNATLNTPYTSNSILVSGNNIPVPISITGGSYSINGGAFVTAAGTVNNGDTVQVQATSSTTSNVTVSAVLTIANQSDSFDISTSVVFTANRSAPFTKQCSAGYTGSTHTYSKTYTSSISQADADNQAATDPNFNAEGQANANSIGTCTPPGYVNYQITEQAYPYVDANMVYSQNGTPFVTAVTNQQGSGGVLVGTNISFQASSSKPSTNTTTGKLKMVVTKNGTQVYSQVVDNNTASVDNPISLPIWSDTVASLDSFDITISSYDDTSFNPEKFTIVNSSGFKVNFNTFTDKGSSTVLDSGELMNGSNINIWQLLQDSPSAGNIRFYVLNEGYWHTTNQPGSTYNEVYLTVGQAVLNLDDADIAALKASGYKDILLNYGS